MPLPEVREFAETIGLKPGGDVGPSKLLLDSEMDRHGALVSGLSTAGQKPKVADAFLAADVHFGSVISCTMSATPRTLEQFSG
jgi:hypothetical protein